MFQQAAVAAASPHSTTPRGGQPSGVEIPTKLAMEPSDEEDEDTGKRTIPPPPKKPFLTPPQGRSAQRDRDSHQVSHGAI